jgi:hypothetical protein
MGIFAEEVAGAVALGYAAHFVMGMFMGTDKFGIGAYHES